MNMYSAKMLLPDLINSNKAKAISPIKDIYDTREELGHLVLFPGENFELKNDLYEDKPFTKSQTDNHFKGSFLFVGTNLKYFHHLFERKFTGKYTDSCVYIDREYGKIIAHPFINILRYYIFPSCS